MLEVFIILDISVVNKVMLNCMCYFKFLFIKE